METEQKRHDEVFEQVRNSDTDKKDTTEPLDIKSNGGDVDLEHVGIEPDFLPKFGDLNNYHLDNDHVVDHLDHLSMSLLLDGGSKVQSPKIIKKKKADTSKKPNRIPKKLRIDNEIHHENDLDELFVMDLSEDEEDKDKIPSDENDDKFMRMSDDEDDDPYDINKIDKIYTDDDNEDENRMDLTEFCPHDSDCACVALRF